MPPEAKIFHVEDSKDFRESLKMYLELCDHKIVETASTRTEALEKIPNLMGRGVNIAIVDLHLTDKNNDFSGIEIARQIKLKCPDITVIGNASKESINTADINCLKSEGPIKLEEIIQNT